MRKNKIFTVVPSAAYTATGNFDLSDLTGNWDEVALYLDVTAASGTSPTLDVVYQTTVDGGTTWFTHTSMTQATAATTEKKVIANSGVYSRILYTIGGTTPSFTFTVRLEVKNNGR